ncbi:hypothetical protein BCR44DRAFT_1138893 [Catenaria anguillulae PL171]|uniref:Autophagy-related protein 16 domain-containing protein n=1 Tax=Catenaria anguillulae PL171 TaxID=765915 RepID=A0A1Y2HLW6_9FUNG|nr:hypothetical protein BCR44DRAFT_1138893 [Catenaria anguillulae PL171]
MPTWLAQLHAQLDKHDQLGAATRDVLDDYTRLFSQTLYLAKSNADMLAQRSSASAQRRVSAAKDTSRPTSAASQQQPRPPIASALSDTTDTPTSHQHPRPWWQETPQPTHRDQLVAEKERVDADLNKTLHQVKQLQSQLAQSERSVRKLSSEVNHLKSTIRDLQIKLHDATHLLTTKDTVIMIAQDELTAAQIELSTKEDKLAFSKRKTATCWIAGSHTRPTRPCA